MFDFNLRGGEKQQLNGDEMIFLGAYGPIIFENIDERYLNDPSKLERN